MRTRLWVSGMIGAGGMLLLAAAPGGPLAFGRIRAGEWQLRATDKSEPVRRVCMSDPAELVQLRHPGLPCSRFVVTNEPRQAAIHYTCTGAGYGRTTIKVETPDLIQIESQGLNNRAPFEITYEARRTGSCTPDEARR